ncbi:TerB family tellurite resistance protein [Bacteroides heparinolyticus]|uniref:TerB family tellurite resistance protein n=1 Tax=Prevotella heparinolytica TaxID=28113 RepID=A0A3P2A9A9_9BACE|nr:TerB family tellurite resistance protein [Bacteroides heparinolyticus]RRD91951.1 TerB family tellurite resistance protein [Bacteroides heparinolyticus]
MKQKKDKQEKLIKLVMELGDFFISCDGNIDERELNFVDQYIPNLVANGIMSKKELEDIRDSLTHSLNIDELIERTKNMISYVAEKEEYPLAKTLSYFIKTLIEADGEIHPNEVQYYDLWKKGIGIDDNTDISDINIDV